MADRAELRSVPSRLRKAQAVIARSIRVIFHLLADPAARFYDLGSNCHDERVSAERKIGSYVRQLEALGLTVTVDDAA
jgi:transposase